MSENSNTCVVCYRNVHIYSIGICEHPVCYECSTRMRVLCQQNECPICRQDLPKVVFTENIQSFGGLRTGSLFNAQYNIYFDSLEIKEIFDKLLSHACSICPDKQKFETFKGLKDHIRNKHEKHYCDLCVRDLRIFSHERRCYSRSDLARHRRKGDVDDKSHKGHPLCEFCDQRYMDNDELYRHLRRDHLFCHFCDADGLHHYYSSYDYLREHFAKEHFLCEEGTCMEEKFTSVFRSDIDLKAHKATIHGKQLGKVAAKQARTLELEFTLAPRDHRMNRRQGPSRGPRDYYNDFEEGAVGGFSAQEEQTIANTKQLSMDMHSTQDFPTLGNTAAIIPQVQKKGRGNLMTRGGHKPGQITDEDFPALGSSSDSPIPKSVNLSVTSSSSSGVPRSSSLAGPNLSIHVNHKPNGTVTTRVSGPNIRIRPGPTSEDFPALSSTSSQLPTNKNMGQWTTVARTRKTEIPQGKKVTPPTQPIAPTINDFPTLQKSNKQLNLAAPSDATKGKAKKKKVPNSQNGSAKSENSEKKSTKSEAKKETASAAVPSPKEPKKKENGVGSGPKKRSELKIESLNLSNNNVQNAQSLQRGEDFPALKSSRPPPGFNNRAAVVAPPPGFFGRAVNKAPQGNGLTFMNSSGESYAIVPNNNRLPKHAFIEPPDFSDRNQNLVSNVREVLEDQDVLSEFRYASGLFRRGVCDAEEYYVRCRNSMGISAFEKIFPELLALLPDIRKQQELFKIHKKECSGRVRNLEVCTNCKQILRSCDLKAHVARHALENQFPTLGLYDNSK